MQDSKHKAAQKTVQRQQRKKAKNKAVKNTRKSRKIAKNLPRYG